MARVTVSIRNRAAAVSSTRDFFEVTTISSDSESAYSGFYLVNNLSSFSIDISKINGFCSFSYKVKDSSNQLSLTGDILDTQGNIINGTIDLDDMHREYRFWTNSSKVLHIL